jgi:hypothetical protein
MERIRSLQYTLDNATSHYRYHANNTRALSESTIPKARFWLQERDSALEKFEDSQAQLAGIAPGSGSSGGVNSSSTLPPMGRVGPTTVGRTAAGFSIISSGTTSTPTAVSSNSDLLPILGAIDFGGGQGRQYRAARQDFMQNLTDNPTQPDYVRNWIKQGIHHLNQIRQNTIVKVVWTAARMTAAIYGGFSNTQYTTDPQLKFEHEVRIAEQLQSAQSTLYRQMASPGRNEAETAQKK